MPWQELKKRLMIYFPGSGWAYWTQPSERVYEKWYEDCVTRGHQKEITLMIVIEEDEAVEITSGGAQHMGTIKNPESMHGRSLDVSRAR